MGAENVSKPKRSPVLGCAECGYGLNNGRHFEWYTGMRIPVNTVVRDGIRWQVHTFKPAPTRRSEP